MAPATPYPAAVVESCAAAVHAGYVTEKHRQGVRSCLSRYNGADLLVGFDQLAPEDQADDVRSVVAVLDVLRDLGPEAVIAALWPHLTDEALLDALCDMFQAIDPPPTGLGPRMASAAAAARSGLDAAAVTRSDDEADRDRRGNAW